MRAGLIHAVPGRGSGQGGASYAALARHAAHPRLAATESLIQVESETKAIANLKIQDNAACPITGKKAFGAALSAVLSSVDLDRRLAWIDVVRGGKRRMAELVLRKEPGTYYTDDQLRQLGAAGTLPNREKLHGTIDSRFRRWGCPVRWTSSHKGESLFAPRRLGPQRQGNK